MVCKLIRLSHLSDLKINRLSNLIFNNMKMKKYAVLIISLLLVAFAMNTKAQGLGIGLKAGMNFANQKITDINTNSRTGFHGGIYAIIAFSEKWGIQPELLYSSQGSELPDDINDFSYMSIPLLLRWKMVSFLSLSAGPQFSILLDAKDQTGESFKDQFKKSDFGLALGATVHLPLGLNAGARYVWGFTNVSELQNDISVKNTTIQVFAGWTIIGKK